MNKVVTLGETMLRLSAPGHARFTQAESLNVAYGGSEANVGISLSLFGLKSEYVTAFPDNDFGEGAVMHLKKFGVNTDSIQLLPGRMGVYFLENGSMQRSSRIIYDRFDSVFANLKRGAFKWEAIMKDAGWFHWSGITPAISQGAADVCLEAIQWAKRFNVPVSGDINYRRNLWQYGKTAKDVMPEMIKDTNLVVGGAVDIENCTGISGDSFEKSCRALMEKYPSVTRVSTTERNSVSSSHNKLSGLLYDGKNVIRSKEYDLTHIVDRVGAGDGFMAGLIYGALNKKSDQDTLEFAVAAGVLKHSIEADVNLVTVQEVEALVHDQNVGKLLR